MRKLYALEGKVQRYVWGGKSFIPNILRKDPSTDHSAEYWLGAHRNAPSFLKTDAGAEPLDRFINDNLNGSLGENVTKAFGRLPYLFKVLDVKDMLSIQVHPTKIEAEKGFKKENELKIPLTAPNRNYKDDNHKPEIMVALSEFWLLHGFLEEGALTEVLNTVPELKDLLSIFEKQGYYGLYEKVMTETAEETNRRLSPLVKRILPLYDKGRLEKSDPNYWAAKAVKSLGNDLSTLDKGIYSIYFFNIVKVSKGEAVFQDAGIPHAYLEGQNMELMANSDNVLRGGLTPKHVDVPELLKHVKFQPTTPSILKGTLMADGLERIYKSPAPDFELSQITIEQDEVYHSESSSVSIVMVLEGEATISEGDTRLSLKQGDSAILLNGAQYHLTTDSRSVLYKASVPRI